MQFLFNLIYGRISRSALRQILEGRMRQRGRPAAGRFLRADTDRIHRQTWRKVQEILPEAGLDRLSGWGNRHNIYLAVVTVGLFHSLLEEGIDGDYAIELLGDVGWKLYVRFLPLPKTIARLRTSDPQERMNFVLDMLLRFPFSAPGRPGYEVRTGETDEGARVTDWTWCPPFAFVRSYVDRHGDRGELKAFFHTWCQYDWAFADAIVEGTGYTGRYSRQHTLARGDEICDMTWGVEPERANERASSESGKRQDGVHRIGELQAD